MATLSIRERQLRAREEAILEGAHELLATKGYQAMTMDDLAASLAVSKATLYQHFRSKEELAVRVITRLARGGMEYLRSLDPTTPPARKLEAMIGYIVARRYGEGHPDLSDQIPALLPVLMQDPEYRTTVAEILSRLSALMEAGKADGDIDPALSTPVAVRAILGLMRDTDYQPLIADGQCTAEDLRETLTRFVLGGLHGRSGAPAQMPDR